MSRNTFVPTTRLPLRLFAACALACVLCSALPAAAQRYDVGNGIVATFAPPPGWEPYENPVRSVLNDSECWRTRSTGATVCIRTVSLDGRSADTIVADERTEAALECTEEQTLPEDLPDGGRAVWLSCIDKGLFGPIRRTWLALAVPGPSRAVFVDADETRPDGEVEQQIRTSMRSVRFERSGPDPTAGKQSRTMGGGWWMWYQPPPGWRTFTTDEYCFASPDAVGTICFETSYYPDRTVSQALNERLGGLECLEQEDSPREGEGLAWLFRRCIVRVGPRTERRGWLAAVADGANYAAFVSTSETEAVDSVTRALETAIGSIFIGRK